MNKIIRANLQHLNDLAILSRTSFLQAFGEQYLSKDMTIYLQNAFNKKELANQLGGEECVFFLLKNEKEYFGYYKVRWDVRHEHFKNEKAIRLERIYLLEKYHRQGFGKMLLEHSIDFCKKEGFDWVWLGVWEENKNAIGFYKRNNFEKFGTEIFHFGNQKDTDWLMKRAV